MSHLNSDLTHFKLLISTCASGVSHRGQQSPPQGSLILSKSMPALGGWRLEDQKFKVILNYIMSSNLA